jgi:hypothetical protein
MRLMSIVSTPAQTLARESRRLGTADAPSGELVTQPETVAACDMHQAVGPALTDWVGCVLKFTRPSSVVGASVTGESGRLSPVHGLLNVEYGS